MKEPMTRIITRNLTEKKRGRPRKGEKLVSVVTMLNTESAKILTRLSRINGRSRSSHIAKILEQYIEENSNGETEQERNTLG
jgi:hypothetical protein